MFVTREGLETSNNGAAGSTNLLVVGHKASHGFAPSSGTAGHNSIFLNPIINQTGTATGTTRGVYINPTLTSASDWHAVDIANNSGFGIYQSGVSAKNYFNGNVGIGTTNPSAKLQIKSGNLIVEDPIDDGSGIRPSFNHIQNGYSLLKIYDKSGNSESYIRNLNNSLFLGNPYVEKLVSLVNSNVGIANSDPKATLHIGGSLALPITSKTANYTVTANDYTITGDATSGNITFTLPTAVGIAGVMYVVKKIDASGNSVIIDGAGAETIDGAASVSITTQYQSVVLQSNGANWYKIN